MSYTVFCVLIHELHLTRAMPAAAAAGPHISARCQHPFARTTNRHRGGTRRADCLGLVFSMQKSLYISSLFLLQKKTNWGTKLMCDQRVFQLALRRSQLLVHLHRCKYLIWAIHWGLTLEFVIILPQDIFGLPQSIKHRQLHLSSPWHPPCAVLLPAALWLLHRGTHTSSALPPQPWSTTSSTLPWHMAASAAPPGPSHGPTHSAPPPPPRCRVPAMEFIHCHSPLGVGSQNWQTAEAYRSDRSGRPVRPVWSCVIRIRVDL